MKSIAVMSTRNIRTWQHYQPWTPSIVYKIRASINTNPRTVVTPNLLSLVVPNLLSSGCNSLENSSKPFKVFFNSPPSPRLISLWPRTFDFDTQIPTNLCNLVERAMSSYLRRITTTNVRFRVNGWVCAVAYIHICNGGDIKYGNVNLGRSGGAAPSWWGVWKLQLALHKN